MFDRLYFSALEKILSGTSTVRDRFLIASPFFPLLPLLAHLLSSPPPPLPLQWFTVHRCTRQRMAFSSKTFATTTTMLPAVCDARQALTSREPTSGSARPTAPGQGRWPAAEVSINTQTQRKHQWAYTEFQYFPLFLALCLCFLLFLV